MPELVGRILPFIAAALFGLLGFNLGAGSVSEPYWLVEDQLADVTTKVDEAGKNAFEMRRSSREVVTDLQTPKRSTKPSIYVPPPTPGQIELDGPDYKMLYNFTRTNHYSWRFRARNTGGQGKSAHVGIVFRDVDGKILTSTIVSVLVEPGKTKVYRGLLSLDEKEAYKLARVTIADCSKGDACYE